MSEQMDLTSPTHGCIYACPSRTFTIPEPSIQPQPSYPVIPPQISNSVPPNLHSANRRLQPLLSPSFISSPLSLPNIHSPTPDIFLHHQPVVQPQTYRRLHNPHLHQPTIHNSPGLSYVTHHSIIPSPIAAPVPHAPIPDLERSLHTHSCIASLRPPSIAFPIENSYSLQYTPAVIPDAVNLPLQTPSQARSNPNVHVPIRTPSSVTIMHHSHPISLFRQTPPHMNNYPPQPDDPQYAHNNFPQASPPLPNNYFVPLFTPPPFAPPPFQAHPPITPPPFHAPNNFLPPHFAPAALQAPYNFIPPIQALRLPPR